MKVKTTSWHYRLWRFGREADWKEPRDLCRYFWHIFIVKVLLPAAAATLVLMGIGFLAYIIWSNPITTVVVLGFVVLGVVLLIGLGFLIKKMVDRNKRLKEERLHLPPEPEPDPSVLFEYLKARKQKLCPLIEVVKGEKAR